MLLFSCSKAEQVTAPDDSNLVKVTLIAGNPQVNPGTKTEISGTTPYWSVGDVIGVSNGTSSNESFSTSITSASKTAEFTGTTVSGDLYAYYPYTTNGVGSAASATGAKVDIPANQNPTVSSFDSKADLMVAKQFTVSPENTTVSGLQFKRLSAIVKVVLKDNTTGTVLASQHPSSVSLETSEDGDLLAGRAVIDFENQSLSEIYYNGTKKVTANYTSSTHFLINSSNAAYFSVYPRELQAGTTLTVTASTEDYEISKVITIPAGGINLEAGKITTLNIGLSDAQVTASSSGLALPFVDDFSWQTDTSEKGLTDEDVDDKWSAFERAYAGKAAGAVRIGTGSATGHLTTAELDLSSAFHVIVSAYAYNASDDSKIEVVVDGETTKIAEESMTSTTTATDYIFNFDAATNKSKVKITTNQKRAILTNVQIISGTYVFPPVINVTTATPISVANTASTGNVIAYTINNPVTGVSLTASSTDSWISNIAVASGQVTFDVAANTGSARSGVITLKYTGAPDVEVIVNQESSVVTSTYEYLFNSKSWGATRDGNAENWTSGSDGYQYNSGNQGIQITTGYSGANGTSPFSFNDIETIEVTYCTNASSGVGVIKVTVGNGATKTFAVTKPSSGGTTLKTATFSYSTVESGKVNIEVECTTNSIFINKATIKAASIVLPTSYDIVCNSTTNGTISTNVNKAIEGQEVTITAEPSSGYVLSSLSVIGESSTSYTVTNSKFTMPAEKVYISATFTEGSAGGTAIFTFGSNITSTSGLIDGVTLSTAKNSGSSAPAYNSTSQQLRLYRYNSMTLSCSGTIKSIVINYATASDIGSDTDSNVGSYSCTGSVGTWTGSSSSVTITNTGTTNVQMRITSIEVTYE